MKYFLLIMLFLIAVPCFAQSRNSLKGIKSMGVLIENLETDAKELGLSPEQLQTDVEVRLRKAGIAIASMNTDPGYLYIQISVLRTTCGAMFCISVEFNQNVTIMATRQKAYDVTTWDSGGLGNAVRDPRFIRDALGDHIERFINDYLTVNPK
ncbi:MAG TPA: hypothetical protein VE732_06495 [Nitrososphaera sp.]|nr:hypothetical protein [Nitrososphaera sp.]